MGLRHILLNRPDRFNSSSDEGDYIDRTSIETESADSDAPYGADVDDDEDDEDPTAHLFLLPMPSFQAQSTTSPRGKDGAAGLPIAVNFESSMRNRHSIQALPEMGWTHKSQPRRMDPSSMEPMNEDNPFTRRRTEAIIAKSEDPRSADHATMDSNMDEEDLDERNQYRRQTSGKRVYRHKLTLSDNGPEKTRLKIFTRYIPQDTWDSGGDSRTTSARLAYVSDSATIQDRERPREWNDPDYATDASSEDPDQVHEVDEEDTSQIGENHPEDTSQVSETAPEDGPSFAVHMDSHTMQSSTSNPSLASQGPYIRQTAPVMRSTIHLVQTYQAIQQLIQTADLEEDAARSKSSSAPYYYPKQGEIIGDGRYRVVGYLGRGSFGCVVKALVLSESQQLANRADSSATTPKGGPEDPFSDLHQTVGGSTSTGGHGSQFPFPPLNLPKSQPQRPSQRSARSTASSQDGSSSMGDEGSEMDEDEELEQYVAIKISRKGASFLQQGKREVSMLERIHNYQSKQENHDLDLFVRALDTFFLDGHLCIVLELLADSLFDLVKYSWDVRPERPGLSLRMVRKMTHQLLCALITLRNMKIIHCDLKPENIALTQPNKPRLKVLDFGSSCSLSDSYLNQFPYIQSRYYRAPEILLGTGYSCSIDMWSLGCVVAELYLGRPLFEGSNSVEQIYCIIDILGMPSDNVLRNAVYLSKFFQKVGVDEQGRSILGPVRKTNLLPKTTIKELVESKNESNTPLHLKYFTDLLVRMLKWDPQQRITPLEAVNHNFILYGPKSNGD
jgi:dual specificity tyrosine-phosphorylation-regulated kinase 2/3/4